ncbi:MAG TPA: ATP-dependent DNA helicase, partial [Steroidobacteraceae bacterium]|nr:ATP-dependent DNA helicase [Steroidobacteraceae bacterium]
WTVADGWRVGMLVDEAHNLIERARKMYSASLDQDVFNAGRRDAPASIKPSLDGIARVWNSATRMQDEPYRVYDSLPDGLLGALDKAVAAILDYLGVSPTGLKPELQTFFFAALRFCRLAADFDAGTLFEIDKVAEAGTRASGPSKMTEAAGARSVLCLRNIVPRRYLAPRFAAAHATVLFSATLAPHAFFRDVLGLPKEAQWIDVRSPFHPDQLAVRLVPSISTRFRDRERSLAPIAKLVARQYDAQPGNYLAFFSSFDYLNRVAAMLEARHPAIPVWKQSRDMTEPARTTFLERFALDGRGIGFAVLGGAFAEGIDLPGSRLIGAFIATLGLPQINAVNEEMQRRMHAMFGTGFEYTYLYPGIQKVVQAAGRVIRARSDRGVLYLIDDRFTHAEVHELLPAWWRIAGQLPVASASGDQPSGSKVQRSGSAPAR